MLKEEWKKLLKNKMLMVVIAAVILIPTIYTTLFLGSMWDPYGKLDKLPVAVVNQDKAVTYQSKELKVGEELIENLKKEKSLHFNFVNQDAGERGLKNGTFYMVITIPEDFSANAATLLDEKPEKMKLKYQTNPGTNYIASKMSESAMEKIKNSIAQEVTKTYVKTVFEEMEEVGDGIQQAADGSRELDDGVVKLSGGNQEITRNLKTLADSSLTFEEGSQTLASGLSTYTDGVEFADRGAAELKGGTASLDSGIKQLEGKVPELEGGAFRLAEGSASLASGSGEVLTGSVQIKEGAQLVDDNLKVLNSGLEQLKIQTAGLPQASDKIADSTENLDNGAVQLQDLIHRASDGAERLQAGAQDLGNGLSMLDGNSQPLLEGLDGVENAVLQSIEGMTEASAVSASEATQNDVTSLRAALDEAMAEGDIDRVGQIAEAAIEAAESSNAEIDEFNLGTAEIASAADAAEEQITGAFAQYKSQLQGYTEGVRAANEGSGLLLQGLTGSSEQPGLVTGLQGLEGGMTELQAGLDALSKGTSQLSNSAPLLTEGIEKAAEGGIQLQQSGTVALKSGSEELYQGIQQLHNGSAALRDGSGEWKAKLPELTEGVSELSEGSGLVKTGTDRLAAGMDELAFRKTDLLNGSAALSSGAAQIGDGASKLHAGSEELGLGLAQVSEGTDTLKASLFDGAKQVKEARTGNDTTEMFASPVTDKETKMTNVENNGHAMAPYMMSVALWVGCIAFSLMYPLTSYQGKLKSGFAWWMSKASVLYLVAILQAVVMVGLLHAIDGFSPQRMGLTLAVACLASVTFMSIMYFFTNSFGKAGSFLMLIFMVIQLAGSVGTYPLELSGDFVSYLHDWVPFTYTVEAFRSTISGGESIQNAVGFLVILWILFTLLTILEFRLRARKIKAGKPVLETWLEEKGLA